MDQLELPSIPFSYLFVRLFCFLETQWIFGMPINKSRGYTEDEVEFSKVMMTYWTNFAKTG